LTEKPKIDQVLINRFFKNECTDAENEAVLEWLGDPENKLLAQAAMEHHWIDNQSPQETTDVDVENLLTKTQQKITALETSSPKDNRLTLESYKATKRFMKIAAIWMGFLIVSSALIFFIADHQEQTQLPIASKEKVEPRPGTEELKSSSGQIVNHVLSDGTKVSLNAQSTLTFPSSFSGHASREVILNGEAFFDVAEDKDHPFIVTTRGVTIMVLGTAFNLKSYEGDPTIETTLIRGKVLIENNHGQRKEKVEMKPNQKAIFSHATEKITLMDVMIKEPTDWNNETLEFEDDTFYDVIKSLERWYGVTIHMNDSASMNCRLTAKIDKESLGQTLEILKSLTGIHYEIGGEEVFIKGKICEE
jgi:ferric-dicitrate binding protein FerR (iron transport regulator)